MQTSHHLFHGDARSGFPVPPGSVHLAVTSPPYPMIAMWDALFAKLSPEAGAALERGDGAGAWEAMHRELDRAWVHLYRSLVAGGIACVNIGDAVRSVAGSFRLYSNHARVIDGMARAGFTPLPDILWRKPTNAPNRFMGSGMLPAGAYVTYEHEYVLVFRKGGLRRFDRAGAALRRRSAFFWEERNRWFSDLWSELLGARQRLDGARARSAAFPFELAWRLVHMYSLQGETVLDPFAGTGTTAAAALAAGRSSASLELDAELAPVFAATLESGLEAGRAEAAARLRAHLDFVEQRSLAGRPPAHANIPYGFPVVTAQERHLELLRPVRIEARAEGRWTAECEPAPLEPPRQLGLPGLAGRPRGERP